SNNPSRFEGDQRPVERVSFDDVEQFLSRLSGLISGLHPQLPTEAQWEYACRAGTTDPFSFGQSITTDQANFNGNYSYRNTEKGVYRETTVDVKLLPRNNWGLYQMHGNVWEWCADGFGEYTAEPQINPYCRDVGSRRVVRGGSWFNLARIVRSACRFRFDPGFRDDFLGFRLLGSAGPVTQGMPSK
ncbi:MAG: formylglycine-generating enzyme family protein, partial [Candidatus Accumulibacter sp.]|nr:formylglycine-generating enzyme family protein [Accumulibacter sp.]